VITRAAPRARRRTDLLKRVERWTHGRKIRLCAGLRANVVSVADAILAHGLAYDEIDRWMEAYTKLDFEALKVGYARKCRAQKSASSSWSEHRDTVASG
jgi:hypothetical protein